MTIYRYTLLRGLRQPFTLLLNVLFPLVLLFIRPLWTGAGTQGFALLNLLVMFGAFMMSQCVLVDKVDGAIVRILVSPVTMFRYLLENLLAAMTPLLVQSLFVALIGSLLYDWTLTFSLGIFLNYAVLTLSAVAMSFAWFCLFKEQESSTGSFGAMLTLMTMVSGALVPLSFFPEAIRHAGAIFPVYWGTRGVLSLIEVGNLTEDYWLGLLAMFLFALAFLLYGGKRKLV